MSVLSVVQSTSSSASSSSVCDDTHSMRTPLGVSCAADWSMNCFTRARLGTTTTTHPRRSTKVVIIDMRMMNDLPVAQK
jgi:hypothetical protein